MIEAELRSFIDDADYIRLRALLDTEGTLEKADDQTTHYLDCAADVRVQWGSHEAKMWSKSGKMHDAARDETEVHLSPEDARSLFHMLKQTGLGVKVSWYRSRRQYAWRGITVCLDDTRGYGKIIEVEKMCEPGAQDAAQEELRAALSHLGVTLTPKEEFSRRFSRYVQHWKELV